MTRLLPVLAVLAVAQGAHADGRMVVAGRELFHEGPRDRAYCSASGSGSNVECERVKAKVLSGYTYGRGYVSGGVVGAEGHETGAGWLRVSWMAADLPGGALAVASLDGVIGDEHTTRLRLSVLDAESLFVCRDAQRDLYVAPLIGMFTRDCVPFAWLAADAGLLTMQWDVAEGRLGAEWLRAGPAFELLANGLGYEHVLRSIQLALPFDLRTVHVPELEADTLTTLGVSLRLTAYYRSPAWEARLSVRARTSLAGAETIQSDNSVAGEVLLLHNFFLFDSLVLQAGMALRASWAQKPENTFVVWANARENFGAFVGLHVGWVHEAPDI